MSVEEHDWIVYLDDTLKRLADVGSSHPIDVGELGNLPKIDVGYNEEFSIKNESSEVVYFVRGRDVKVIPIPVASQPMFDLDTIGGPNISIYIRSHQVNCGSAKKNKNEAMRYGLDSRKLINESIYIPELGGFLCSLAQLTRVERLCRAQYRPIAPDAATPVWIHAHMECSHLEALYATVNHRIVRVKVRKGHTEYARNRIIYYQWEYHPDRMDHDTVDSIPADHFLTHSLWKTKHGEYVATSYQELKILLSNRGIDMDYIQTLRDENAKKEREITQLRARVSALASPEVQEDFIKDMSRTRRMKHLNEWFGVADRVTSTAKAGQEIHEKYKTSKRKSVDDSFNRIRHVIDTGSGIMRVLTPTVNFIASVIKLFG